MNTVHDTLTLERCRIRRIDLMVKCILGMVLLMLSYYMARHSVYDAKDSDMRAHIEIAMSLNRSNILMQYLTGKDRLWHTLVRVVNLLPGWNEKESACLVTSVVYTSYYWIACAILEREVNLPEGAAPAACLILCVVSSIAAPWYSHKIYLSSDSPNPWHSPTQIMAKLFALLLFTMTANLYNRLRQEDGDWSTAVYRSKGEAAAYTLLITFSVYAKPCLFQVIVPGLGILMVIDLMRSRGKSFLFSLKMAAAFVPGAVLTAMMFVSAFLQGDGENGVAIEPLVAWSRYCPSIPFSLLLLLAFPLFVFIMDRRNYLESAENPLAVSMLCVGIVMRALLIETGERRAHGNFSWGFNLAVALIWFVAIKRFCRMISGEDLSEGEHSISAAGGCSLLTLHAISGMIYIVHLMTSSAQC